MRYLWQHIGQILSQYDGTLPLHHFLKAYFRCHPKLGSRDRRGLADAVYSWYRAGKALSGNGHEAHTLQLAAMYVCDLRPRAFESFFPPSWTAGETDLAQRIIVLSNEGIACHPELIFPDATTCSTGITADEWRTSMLRQPRLFLRIRSGRSDVERKLTAVGIAYEWIKDDCLALPNGTHVEGLLRADSYVVQDASSQATATYLHAQPGASWWDCCAGAGGKSLMLKDASPGVRLLATDLRQSILANLRERFQLYNHTLPQTSVLDAGDTVASTQFIADQRFDGIICDVPCSGSGTWARTPESCYFFHPGAINEYAARQRDILRNAGNYLTSSGRIIYITCSVFRAENEDVIESIEAEGSLKIVSAGLINGLAIGADALFAAELRRA